MGSINLLTAQAGTRAQALPTLPAERPGCRRPWATWCRLCPYSCRADGRYSPCEEGPAPDLPRWL